MASKELVDQYVKELGTYYTLCFSKFFREYGGENKFLTDLIICPHEYDHSLDIRDAKLAIQKFNKDIGEEIGVELNGIEFDGDLKPIYYLSIYLEILTKIDYENPVQFTLTEVCEMNVSAIACLVDEIADNDLMNEIRQVQMNMLKV